MTRPQVVPPVFESLHVARLTGQFQDVNDALAHRIGCCSGEDLFEGSPLQTLTATSGFDDRSCVASKLVKVFVPLEACTALLLYRMCETLI